MVEKFLEGKGALITGGASGFGKGVARAFAEKGADLVLVDNNNQLLQQTTKDLTTQTGRKIVPIVCDVSKFDQVEAMAKQAFNELENIYILFNNAGISLGYRKDFIKIDEDLYDLTMNVNLKGQRSMQKNEIPKISTFSREDH